MLSWYGSWRAWRALQVLLDLVKGIQKAKLPISVTLDGAQQVVSEAGAPGVAKLYCQGSGCFVLGFGSCKSYLTTGKPIFWGAEDMLGDPRQDDIPVFDVSVSGRQGI